MAEKPGAMGLLFPRDGAFGAKDFLQGEASVGDGLGAPRRLGGCEELAECTLAPPAVGE